MHNNTDTHLNFNYTSLASFCLAYLPCYTPCIKLAFSGFDHLVQEDIMVQEYNNPLDLISIHLANIPEPAFYLTMSRAVYIDDNWAYQWAGKTWNTIIKSTDAIILDKYQIWSTQLKDFYDEYLDEWKIISDSCVVLYGWKSENKLYNARFYFSASNKTDTFENFILSEVWFEFSDYESSPEKTLWSQETIDVFSEDLKNKTLDKKQKSIKKSNKTKQSGLKIIEKAYNISLAKKKALKFSKPRALESYKKLHDLVVHNFQDDNFENKLQEAFQESKQRSASGLFNIVNEHSDMFMILDWKASSQEFMDEVHTAISLQDTWINLDGIKADNNTNYSDSILTIQDTLKQAWYNLVMLDTHWDFSAFCICSHENLIPVISHLITTWMYK